MGGRNVAKAMPREHFTDGVGGRRGIEYEIGLRLGGFLLGKRVVQKVVEDLPVEVGRLREIVPQPFAGRDVGTVTHSSRQPSSFVVGPGKRVRLPVVENLESVLDRPQERVVPLQDLPLLVGEAAGFSKPADGLERGARANPWRVAAAEKLQELDRKLDVTDAAAAAFHVEGVGPLPDRPLLDAALERLDAADVGP